MIDRPTLRLLVFPASDTALRRDVEAIVRTIPRAALDPSTATVVEQRLRRMYRNVQVRPRDTFGGYDSDPVAVWYVYRDGRIRARNEARERLYGVLAAARETVRSSERALQNAVGAATGAGYRDVEGHRLRAEGDDATATDDDRPSELGSNTVAEIVAARRRDAADER